MPEWMLQILGIAGTAAGIYAAIRSDLAALRVKAEAAVASAGEAHHRIDRHVEVFHRRKGDESE